MPEASKNLMVERSQPSVWDRQSLSSTIATYDQERCMAAACGTVMAMLGARRGGFLGGLLATAGASLAVRAAVGRHDMALLRDWIERAMQQNGWRPHDIVEQASDESFPASDSPSWTSTTAGTARR